jgi:hypothetical protein
VPSAKQLARKLRKAATEQHRLAALCAYMDKLCDEKAAAKYLISKTSLFKNHSKKAVAEYILYQVQKVRATGSLADAARPGRPHKVDDKTAAKAAQLLKAGYKDEEGQRHHFNSMAQALAMSDKLAAILEAAHCSPRTLHVSMQDADPHLKYGLQEHKFVLDEMVKRARQQLAETMAAWTTADLEDIVFVDAKKMVVDVHNVRVYFDDREELPVIENVHSRHPNKKKDLKFLYYYAAVNAKLGVVHFKYVTGTTELVTGYKVCEAALGCAGLL